MFDGELLEQRRHEIDVQELCLGARDVGGVVVQLAGRAVSASGRGAARDVEQPKSEAGALRRAPRAHVRQDVAVHLDVVFEAQEPPTAAQARCFGHLLPRAHPPLLERGVILRELSFVTVGDDDEAASNVGELDGIDGALRIAACRSLKPDEDLVVHVGEEMQRTSIGRGGMGGDGGALRSQSSLRIQNVPQNAPPGVCSLPRGSVLWWHTPRVRFSLGAFSSNCTKGCQNAQLSQRGRPG